MLRQREPFQRSAKAVEPAPRVGNDDPTAIQKRLDTQDASANDPDRARGNARRGPIVQPDPFQRSRMGVLRPITPFDPTATQNRRDGHDNPLMVPVGAKRCVVQTPACHTSASGPSGPEPTATQNLAKGHETTASCPAGSAGPGTG